MLEEVKELDSVLIRFENGAAKGACAYYNEGIKRDGVWVAGAVQQGAAVPLSLVDADDGPTLEAVLGKTIPGLAARVAELEAELGTLKHNSAVELAAKDATAQTLLEQAAAMEADLRAQLAAIEADRDAALAAQAQFEQERDKARAEAAGLAEDLRALRVATGTLVEPVEG